MPPARPRTARRAGRPEVAEQRGCRTVEPGPRRWLRERAASACCLPQAFRHLEVIARKKRFFLGSIGTHRTPGKAGEERDFLILPAFVFCERNAGFVKSCGPQKNGQVVKVTITI